MKNCQDFVLVVSVILLDFIGVNKTLLLTILLEQVKLMLVLKFQTPVLQVVCNSFTVITLWKNRTWFLPKRSKGNLKLSISFQLFSSNTKKCQSYLFSSIGPWTTFHHNLLAVVKRLLKSGSSHPSTVDSSLWNILKLSLCLHFTWVSKYTECVILYKSIK